MANASDNDVDVIGLKLGRLTGKISQAPTYRSVWLLIS